MAAIPNLLVIAALAAVATVLVLGVVNLFRGGDAATSQKLMRWRVGLQFVALIVILGVLFFRH